MTTDAQKMTAMDAGSKPSKSAKSANPTKKSQLAAMLARKKGATVAQIETSLGWQPHTIRSAISGMRKAGAEIVLDRSGKIPAYRLQVAAE